MRYALNQLYNLHEYGRNDNRFAFSKEHLAQKKYLPTHLFSQAHIIIIMQSS